MTHFFRARGFIFPQKPSLDLAGSGCPVAYVEESAAAPEVLAGVEAGAAGVALVCGAPFAAGASCAIAGTPKLAASKIAAIDPGVAVHLFTLVPLSAHNKIR